MLLPPATPPTLQSTEELPMPFMLATNCCDLPDTREIEAGVTVTTSGIVTVAPALMLLSAALVAAIVTLPPSLGQTAHHKVPPMKSYR